MVRDDSTHAGHISSTHQDVRTTQDDNSELIAYYENQRRSGRSHEWAKCLDATLRQLRQS